MSTSVAGLSTNFFPDAENGFTTTTAGSVASAAATVTLNSVAGYTNGLPVVLVIDPTDSSKKQTFTGIIDTSGVQITSVVWTAGTNQIHALGATVVDYATATHIAMISKGILVHADQDGTLKAGAVDVAGVLASNVVTTAKILDANVTLAKIGGGSTAGVLKTNASGVVTAGALTTDAGGWAVYDYGAWKEYTIKTTAFSATKNQYEAWDNTTINLPTGVTGANVKNVQFSLFYGDFTELMTSNVRIVSDTLVFRGSGLRTTSTTYQGAYYVTVIV